MTSPDDATSSRGGLHRVITAFLTARTNDAYEAVLAARKRALLEPLRGRVLEIGPGTGANLVYLATTVEWIGVEPSRPMQAHLRRNASARGAHAHIVSGTAEQIPVDDESVDAVVSTLVLCSVDDPARALAEIRRVLRRGGRFAFVEHVAAPAGTCLRRKQSLMRPLWRAIGDGCRPDQCTAELLADVGFSSIALDRFDVGSGLLAPHICGIAIR